MEDIKLRACRRARRPRRHFPLTADDAQARRRARAVVGWKPWPAPNQDQEEG